MGHSYSHTLLNRRLTRRSALAAGSLGAFAIACGGDQNEPSTGQSGAQSQSTVVAQSLSGATGSGGGTGLGYTAGPADEHPWLGTQEGKPRYGGVGVKVTTGDPQDLNLHGRDNGEVQAIMHLPYDPLMRLIERKGVGQQEMLPLLVKAWEQPDPLTIVLKLQEGVKFHNVPPTNGRVFDSSDVVANFDHVRSKGQYGSVMIDRYEAIDTVTAVDPYTVQIKAKEVFADLLYDVGFAWNVQYSKESIANNLFITGATGTGPYVFEEWQKGIGVKYKRNPEYWQKGLPYLDGFFIAIVPDLATRFAKFVAGEIDYFQPNLRQLEDAKRSISGLQVTELPSAPIARIKFNNAEGPFKDKRVRQSLMYGMDYDLFIQTAFFGKAQRAFFWPTVMQPWALPESELPKTDKQRATQLLQAAGYSPQNPLRFSLTDTQFYGAATYGPPLVSIMADLGVQVEQRFIDNPKWIEQVDNAGRDFEATCHGDYAWDDPHRNLYSDFHSTGVGNNVHYNGGPEMDALLDKIKTEMDREARIKLVHDVQRRIIEDAPHVHWCNGIAFGSRLPTLKGWFPQMMAGTIANRDPEWLWLTKNPSGRNF